MKLRIDKGADALYLSLNESVVVDSEELLPGIVVDYDADNQVIGIEMLHLSKRNPKLDLGEVLIETIAEPTPQ